MNRNEETPDAPSADDGRDWNLTPEQEAEVMAVQEETLNPTPEENFWDDRTTPLAYSRSDSEEDEAVLAQIRQVQAESAEESCKDCGEAHSSLGEGLGDLLDYLTQFFGEETPSEEEAARRAAHEERMKEFSATMRDSMVSADESVPDEFAEDRLMWGLWKTKCGCVHLGLPNGKGGWATHPDELEECATSEELKDVMHAVAQTGLLLAEVALGLEADGR